MRPSVRERPAVRPSPYDDGLRTAREHLRALDAPEPDLPPCDSATHEPIEEIPIESEDERGRYDAVPRQATRLALAKVRRHVGGDRLKLRVS
jgi:hypothetical protein